MRCAGPRVQQERDPSGVSHNGAVLYPVSFGDDEPDPLRARVLCSYAEGVRALVRLGQEYVDWTLPVESTACPAIGVAGHLLATARSCHRLLDASLAGRAPSDADRSRSLVCCGPIPPVPPDRLAAGIDRLVAFDAVATRYGERLADTGSDLRLGVWDAEGRLSATRHGLLLALEWHLHAWDLAGALGWDYRPADVEVLLDGLPPAPSPLPTGGPWEAVLAIAGRRPPAGERPSGP